jgi:hypothetical protein
MEDIKPKYDTEHGSPYDRGSADAYYGRQKDPHWWPEGTYHGNRVSCLDMTATQIEAYLAGYDNEDARKEY